MADEQDDFKHLVRIANTDINGNKLVYLSLTGIKGIGRRVGWEIAKIAGIDPKARLGNLSDEEIERLKNVVENEIDKSIPVWMFNRRKDLISGKDHHIIGVDVDLIVREDINLMKKIRCYRGIRHELGQKVRGQRTRSTGRKGAVVGVIRKKK
ncbi:30S ribosomal protein S13 [Methanosarcinales archaeon]|nr:MAG: 30S ribosomal protein S13 [Methanosarcinales archaeon]